MGDAKQTELFTDLSRVVKKHLMDTYGEPRPGDNLPARVAVALLQLAGVYFLTTGANKKVIRDFVDSVFGVSDEDVKKAGSKSPLRLVTDEAAIREVLSPVKKD